MLKTSSKELKNCIKYHSLEKYLFDEVSKNFKENHFLTPEDFFAIIIWKSNRSKTKVRDGINKEGKTIKQLTEQMDKRQNDESKVKMLKKIEGIGIPVASAILTVCYPDNFTIVDYRVISALVDRRKELNEKKLRRSSSTIKAYLKYVGICKKVAKEEGLSLRDMDRALWGHDFYEGKKGLKDLVSSLKV